VSAPRQCLESHSRTANNLSGSPRSPVVIDGLDGEVGVAAEEEEREAEGDVLVEEVGDHERNAPVAPPPMDQQQPLQVPKLPNRKVARHHGLGAGRNREPQSEGRAW
jgi:hypothetical protein